MSTLQFILNRVGSPDGQDLASSLRTSANVDLFHPLEHIHRFKGEEELTSYWYTSRVGN
jgi:hypothetical protein